MEADLDALGYVRVSPSELRVASPFKDLFPIRPAMLNAIVASMREKGYIGIYPIAVWRGPNVVLDGHTRLEAAQRLGLDVLVGYLDFEDEDQAIEFAIAAQRDRRNLTDAEILKCIEVLDRRQIPGGDPGQRGNRYTGRRASRDALLKEKTAVTTARVIGTGSRKVEKARTVIDRATPEVKQAVVDGRMTINKAYNETRARLRPASSVMSSSGGEESGLSDAGLAEADTVGSESREDALPSGAVIESNGHAGPPPGDDHGPPATSPSESADQAWIESLPLYGCVPTRGFEADARFFRAVAPFVEKIQKTIRDTGFVPDLRPPYLKEAARFARIAGPESWLPCPKCGGNADGVTVTCRRCATRGYILT